MDLRELRDTLTIEEINLFKVVDQWAIKECEKQGSAVNGEQKRRILGEKVMKAIRFPVMKQEEFASAVLDASILTLNEVVTFFKFFSSSLTSPVGFPDTRRSGPKAKTAVIYRCGRFDSVSVGRWDYNGLCRDFLEVTVNKDITLHGLCLCGSERNDYRVTLEIKNATNNFCIASKSGTFSSKRLQYKSGNYHGFDVLNDPP